jgi:cobalamin biosynthesis protein CbiG
VGDLVIVTLTPRGAALARRLVGALGQGEVVEAPGSVRQTLHQLFQAGRPLVCVLALGIVVRVLGPLAQSKRTDPPVVVVDEAGQFAVSVLGGHQAGANELARRVAAALGAVPVITTASDALGLPPLDLIGHSRGWQIENPDQLTVVSAAAVRGEAIAVYQDAGCRSWWREFGEWPATFQRVETLPQDRWAGVLVISDRHVPTLLSPVVVYRPPTLVLGVGCRRGVSCEEIETLFQDVCRSHGFAPLSLGVVATASLKADEPGLREFAARHRVPLQAFTLDHLAGVMDLPTPSEMVRAKIGIAGVAEPAALLASGATHLLVPKYRGQRVTLALARRDEA